MEDMLESNTDKKGTNFTDFLGMWTRCTTTTPGAIVN